MLIPSPLSFYLGACKTARGTALRSVGGVASAISFSLLATLSWTPPSLAQVQTDAAGLSSVTFNAPPLPPGQGAPTGRRDGGASRGNCPEYGDLAALVPITAGRVWGKTTAAQPTLWFYLPAAISPEIPIELIVQDAEDDILYETSLAVAVETGTIAIALPETVTLPVGEPHYWTMALFCDPERPASSVFVNGTIERVSVGGLAPLTADTERSLSQAQVYAEAGIWHDALTILAERQRTNISDSKSQTAWAALLEQVGLAQAATQPVQACCEVE
ncbi:MAG: DUF928 domain-containing protein [Phormidesmis sp.]